MGDSPNKIEHDSMGGDVHTVATHPPLTNASDDSILKDNPAYQPHVGSQKVYREPYPSNGSNG
jgi:hypothetical protein